MVVIGVGIASAGFLGLLISILRAPMSSVEDVVSGMDSVTPKSIPWACMTAAGLALVVFVRPREGVRRPRTDPAEPRMTRWERIILWFGILTLVLGTYFGWRFASEHGIPYIGN